jgi:hypothetical protein
MLVVAFEGCDNKSKASNIGAAAAQPEANEPPVEDQSVPSTVTIEWCFRLRKRMDQNLSIVRWTDPLRPNKCVM